MGEHKYNPKSISAKNGELPPKPKKMSAAERQLRLYQLIQTKMFEKTGLAPGMLIEGYDYISIKEDK